MKGFSSALSKTRVTLLLGINQIRQIKKDKEKILAKSEVVKDTLPGRIINYFGDLNSHTLYFLSDETCLKPQDKMFIKYRQESEGRWQDMFYSFLSNPKPDNSTNISLHAFTRQHSFKLLDYKNDLTKEIDILSQETQIAIYSGVTAEDIEKYENNDNAIENFEN